MFMLYVLYYYVQDKSEHQYPRYYFYGSLHNKIKKIF